MDDYRKASGERHALLRKMMPDWRQIQETLGRVNKNVESVLERSLAIDRHMQEYDDIVQAARIVPSPSCPLPRSSTSSSRRSFWRLRLPAPPSTSR